MMLLLLKVPSYLHSLYLVMNLIMFLAFWKKRWCTQNTSLFVLFMRSSLLSGRGWGMSQLSKLGCFASFSKVELLMENFIKVSDSFDNLTTPLNSWKWNFSWTIWWGHFESYSFLWHEKNLYIQFFIYLWKLSCI